MWFSRAVGIDWLSGGGRKMIIIAFGLFTDHGVFLLVCIKEAHDLGESDQVALATGLERSGRVVSAEGAARPRGTLGASARGAAHARPIAPRRQQLGLSGTPASPGSGGSSLHHVSRCVRSSATARNG